MDFFVGSIKLKYQLFFMKKFKNKVKFQFKIISSLIVVFEFYALIWSSDVPGLQLLGFGQARPDFFGPRAGLFTLGFGLFFGLFQSIKCTYFFVLCI